MDIDLNDSFQQTRLLIAHVGKGWCDPNKPVFKVS